MQCGLRRIKSLLYIYIIPESAPLVKNKIRTKWGSAERLSHSLVKDLSNQAIRPTGRSSSMGRSFSNDFLFFEDFFALPLLAFEPSSVGVIAG